MNNINKQNRNRLIGAENRLAVVGGEGGEGWVKYVKGVAVQIGSYRMVTEM